MSTHVKLLVEFSGTLQGVMRLKGKSRVYIEKEIEEESNMISTGLSIYDVNPNDREILVRKELIDGVGNGAFFRTVTVKPNFHFLVSNTFKELTEALTK